MPRALLAFPSHSIRRAPSSLLGLLSILALAMVLPVTTAQAAPPNPAKVVVMTYNVENMFDIYDDPFTGDEGTDVKTRSEISLIARAIRSQSADIVVFQELENEYLLAQMIKDYLSDQGYDYVAVNKTNSGRGINLGVISKYPIVSTTSHRFMTFGHPQRNNRYRFARDAMQITLDVAGQPLHLFNVHYKSNRTTDDSDPNAKAWRTAEALRTKSMVRDLLKGNPDELVAVLGDFNSDFERRPQDRRDWPATKAILAPEPNGERLLHDLHAGMPREQRITLPGSGRYPPAVFDFITVSPALKAKLVPNSAGVVQAPELTGGSDHFPVYASFNLAD